MEHVDLSYLASLAGENNQFIHKLIAAKQATKENLFELITAMNAISDASVKELKSRR